MTVVRGTSVLPFGAQLMMGSVERHKAHLAEEDLIEEKRMNRLRKAFSLATDLHLTKSQRYDLAQMLVGVDKDDGGSWKDLNPKQLHDLITMMEGYIYIKFMIDNA